MEKKYIVFGMLVVFILVGLTVPIKDVWVDDKYIYGELFCNTYDSSCFSTIGHATLEKLSLFQYLKYKSWEDKSE